MANDLTGGKLTSREACENRLHQLFPLHKHKGCYERGLINKMTKKLSSKLLHI